MTDYEKAQSDYGKKGGKVGGPARAAKLTAMQRSAIAKRAAEARWAKTKKEAVCEKKK